MKKLILTATALVAFATPALADMSERNVAWKRYVAWADARSAQQHNGKSSYSRHCEPESKMCVDSIAYYDAKGTYVLAREGSNIDGRVFVRDVCRFNDSVDIRTCIDWDTSKMTREMKDAKGDWTIVESRFAQQ